MAEITLTEDPTFTLFPSYPPSGTDITFQYGPISKKVTTNDAEVILSKLAFSPQTSELVRSFISSVKIADPGVDLSMTSESEFLIHKRLGQNAWKNLIIDEDGDVEILMIPKNRKKTFNKLFYLSEQYSIEQIVEEFNELR